MMKRILFIFFLIIMALPIFAQDAPEVLVDGLVNPRQMAFDREGNLYIAEAGNGGSGVTNTEEAFGNSSQITMVTPDGEASVVVMGLNSFREGASLGAHALHVTDESIWVLLGESADFRVPWTQALVELDRETARVKTFVDLLTVELEDDPDGNPNQQSNPTDFDVAPDGTIYIANAGCNCLLSWTPDTGVQVVHAWSFSEDNPVPTTVDVDANGDVYVSFLTGFPFPAGGSRIEKWSGGELVETIEGLTTVTDILVLENGRILAVETGMQGPGRVVVVSEDGSITPVAEGLSAPYGLAQAPDGRVLVTVGAFGGQGGQVVVLPEV